MTNGLKKLLMGLLFLCVWGQRLEADWSSLHVLDTGSHPSIAVDAQGHAVAVWCKHDTDNIWVVAATNNGTGWSTPNNISQPIPNTDIWPLIWPHVAVDNAGNAVVIWHLEDNINSYRLPANATTWVATQPPTISGRFRYYPILNIDALGNALLVWACENDNNYQIESARLVPDSQSWETLSPVKVNNVIDFLAIATDPAGNAVTTWSQEQYNDGFPNQIFGATLLSGSNGWSTPSHIYRGLYISDSQVQVDEHGNAFALFASIDDNNQFWNLFSSKLNSGSEKWETTAMAESSIPRKDFHSCHLGLDDRGNALAVWNEEVAGGYKSAKFYKGDDDWTAPEEAVTPLANAKMFNTTLKVDGHGNGILVWLSKEEKAEQASVTLMASTYSAFDITWSAPFALTNTTLEESSVVDVALTEKGDCFVILGTKGSIQTLKGNSLFPSNWKKSFLHGLKNE